MSANNPPPSVANGAHLSVHRQGSADDAATECLADALVAETNPEYRNTTRRLGHQLEADARTVGIAGTGRNDDALGCQRDGIVGGQHVIAPNLHLGPQFAHVVAQVVGKAVVVVDQQQHFISTLKWRR